MIERREAVMRKTDIVSFILILPTIASIGMSVLAATERRLMTSDLIPVPVFLSVWFSGAACSVIGLVYSLLVARRNSEFGISAFGVVSCVGIFINALGVLLLLASIPHL
jgi:hypothetical protein